MYYATTIEADNGAFNLRRTFDPAYLLPSGLTLSGDAGRDSSEDTVE